MSKDKIVPLKVGKDGKCPACSSTTFDVRYTETAWARVLVQDGKVVHREDGRDLEESISEYETALCRKCGVTVDISGLEGI